jgi:hypothetical protein
MEISKTYAEPLRSRRYAGQRQLKGA